MKKFLAIVLAMMMVMVTACSNKPNGAVAKIGKEFNQYSKFINDEFDRLHKLYSTYENFKTKS